jgi:hypothetical protein
MNYPSLFRLRQHFDAPKVDDIPATTKAEVQRVLPSTSIKAGDSVAVAVGSRGIANLSTVVKAIVQELQASGAEPYIVPAMGSHGGGTAEGQEAILDRYGVSEKTMGVPVRASMEVIEIGVSDFGMPIYFDKEASRADHVVVCNRVKPHTGFAGEIESGLYKMMLIGLGKHKGAAIYHRAIIHHSFSKIVKLVGATVIEKMPIAFGVAMLENGYDETARVQAVPVEEFEETEKELQAQAKAWMPSLPFEEVDLLIIDEMGKDVSGAGMDTNVIGRKRNDRKAMGDETPRVLRIFVRDLTETTHGNATGIGLAEFTTDRLVEKIDLPQTYINCVTGQHISAAAIPMHFPTDKEVLDIALESLGLIEPEAARVVWIKNTLNLGEVEVSTAYEQQVKAREDLEILTSPRQLAVGDDGNLPLIEAFGNVGRLGSVAAK